MIVLPNGIGEATGDNLVTCAPLQTRGQIWYVQSTNGFNAAGVAGRSPDRPLATLAQAQTNASAGDIVVLLPAHVESINSLTISKQLTIVGAGVTAGRPSPTITGGAAQRLVIGAAGVELRNVYFPTSTVASILGYLEVGGVADFQCTGCHFEQGANEADASYCFYMATAGATGVRLTNCSFVNTATVATARPAGAIQVNLASLDMRMDGCVLDDGPVGYSFAALYAPFTNTRFRAENLSLLRGAAVIMAAASTGYVNVATSTGNGRVDW